MFDQEVLVSKNLFDFAIDVYPKSMKEKLSFRFKNFISNLPNENGWGDSLMEFYNEILCQDLLCMTVPYNEEIEEVERIINVYLKLANKPTMNAYKINAISEKLEEAESPEEYGEEMWREIISMLAEKEVGLLEIRPIDGGWSEMALIFVPIKNIKKWYNRSLGDYALFEFKP